MQEGRYLSSLNKILDEHLRNELNHGGPPWRTPVTKGWRDKTKDERLRLALRWFRWRFRRNGRGNWTPGKKRWKHLELEFIQQEQTPKEGINHLEEVRIRFIVCLSFIKLNWWQAMDFSYYLFFLKKDWEGIAQDLRRSSWTTDRIEKNEWINMINKEKNLERTTIRIRKKWLMKKNESPVRIRRTNKQDGI